MDWQQLELMYVVRERVGEKENRLKSRDAGIDFFTQDARARVTTPIRACAPRAARVALH